MTTYNTLPNGAKQLADDAGMDAETAGKVIEMCRKTKKYTLKDYSIFLECGGCYCVVRVGPDGVRRNIAPPGVRTKRDALAVAREECWEMKNEAQI